MQCPTCEQEMPIADDTFASRLREARVDQSLSRSDLAEVLGYERTSVITRWESGGLIPRDTEIIETIAAALDTTPAWLLYGVQEPKLFTEVGDAIEVERSMVPDEFEGEPALLDDATAGLPVKLLPPDIDDSDDDWDEWVEEPTEDESTTTSGKARPAILKQLQDES